MKTSVLILALVALATAQNKPLRKVKHIKHGYRAAAQGSNQGGQYLGSDQGATHQHPQYAGQQSNRGSSYNGGNSQNQYNGGNSQNQYNGGQSSPSYSGGGNGQKHTYPLLLADQRTLNTDGTINYNFQADNGLQQGETVDPDGTRRGFYSYPGADGKPLTVKYTAGKNGFIAEGDHLPTQPQAAAASETRNEQPYAPRTRHGRQDSSGEDGQYTHGSYPGDDGDDGSYRPEEYSSSRGGSGSRPQYNAGPSPQSQRSPHHSSPYSSQSGSNSGNFNSFGGGGDDFPQGFSSPQSYSGGGGGGRPSGGTRASSLGGGASQYSGGGGAGRFPQGGAAPSFSSYSSPQSQYSSGGGGGGPSFAPQGGPGPSFGPGPSSRPPASGLQYSADNPYQPVGAGPYNGAFDLGNNGHFSINFNPGSSQEYQPGGQGSSGSSQGQY